MMILPKNKICMIIEYGFSSSPSTTAAQGAIDYPCVTDYVMVNMIHFQWFSTFHCDLYKGGQKM